MTATPLTRNSLIIRIRDRSDADAWREFVSIYEPVIYRVACKRGFQHADAMELVQRVLLAVAKAVDRFQPDSERAKFRTWLYRITHNEFCKELTVVQRQAASGDSHIRRLIDATPGHEVDQEFCLEYRRAVFRWAAQRIEPKFRPSTWQAFYRTSVDNEPVKEVAEELGLSVAAVYIARSRVMARLQTEAARYEESQS